MNHYVGDVLKRHSADIKKLEVLKEEREKLERVLYARRDDIRGVKLKQIDDKVRELDRQIKFQFDATIRRIFYDIPDEDETSMTGSSNSEWPEDETLSSKLNGEEQKQVVVGQGGIGQTKIINRDSKIKITYGDVQITQNNYYGSKQRIG